ncbi:hypothetical protein A2U01_0069095, partial [Trifolium medium]|nr:hypothetical protein [Trifolium medium]
MAGNKHILRVAQTSPARSAYHRRTGRTEQTSLRAAQTSPARSASHRRLADTQHKAARSAATLYAQRSHL